MPRIIILNHATFSSSYNTFPCLFKHVSPCNTTSELRDLCWPWQNCHSIRSTHVGAQNDFFTISFSPLKIYTDLVHEHHKNISAAFSRPSAKLVNADRQVQCFEPKQSQNYFCCYSVHNGIQWLWLSCWCYLQCTLRMTYTQWHSFDQVSIIHSAVCVWYIYGPDWLQVSYLTHRQVKSTILFLRCWFSP